MKLEKVLMNHDKVESFLVNTNNDLVVYGKSLMFQVLLSGIEIEGITLTPNAKFAIADDVERQKNLSCMKLNKVSVNHDKVKNYTIESNGRMSVIEKRALFNLLYSGVEISGASLDESGNIIVADDVVKKKHLTINGKA